MNGPSEFPEMQRSAVSETCGVYFCVLRELCVKDLNFTQSSRTSQSSAYQTLEHHCFTHHDEIVFGDMWVID